MDQKPRRRNRITSESTIINITVSVYFSFNIPVPKSCRERGANAEYQTKKSKTIKEHKSQTELSQGNPSNNQKSKQKHTAAQ